MQLNLFILKHCVFLQKFKAILNFQSLQNLPEVRVLPLKFYEDS